MPQKSMLIKVLLAVAVKLAIVVAAVYWFWPTPKPVMPPQRVGFGISLPSPGYPYSG
jgi:flagellar basal body-associated protein FliL